MLFAECEESVDGVGVILNCAVSPGLVQGSIDGDLKGRWPDGVNGQGRGGGRKLGGVIGMRLQVHFARRTHVFE